MVPPSAGPQFFGEVRIDGRSSSLSVHLRYLTAASLWQRRISRGAADAVRLMQRGPGATRAARASQDATGSKRRLQRDCTARAAWSAV